MRGIYTVCFIFNLARNNRLPVSPFTMKSPTQEWDVDRYQSQHSFVWEYGNDLVDILDAKPGERILDLGCGSGELSSKIAKTGAHVVGMDLDPNMIQKATESFPDVVFVEGDIRSFEFDQKFDAIFSNAAIHWIPPQDVSDAALQMSKALKPQGRLVVEFGGKRNVHKITQVLTDVTGVDSPWYFPSIGHFATVLEMNDIEVLHAQLFDRPTDLEGEDGMKNWLSMFGSYFLKNLDETELERTLLDAVELLKPHLLKEDGWKADYRRIRVLARKVSH